MSVKLHFHAGVCFADEPCQHVKFIDGKVVCSLVGKSVDKVALTVGCSIATKRQERLRNIQAKSLPSNLPSLPDLPLPWPAAGRLIWNEIHARARDYVGDAASEVIWHHANRRRLPCGACGKEYREWIESLTQGGHLATAAMYRRATWEFHNFVNRHIGVDELSFERAAAEHGWSVEEVSTP